MSDRVERDIARAVAPHAFAQMEEIAVTVERLTAYGIGLGLTKEEALEVITVWSRETPLSVVADEKAFHTPLMFRSLGDWWEPSRFIGAAALARQVIPLVELIENQQ